MDVDDRVEVGLGHLAQGGVPCDARVVDHHIEGTEPLDAAADGGLHRVGVGDVAGDGGHLGAGGVEGAGARLGRGAVDVGDDDARAVLVEGRGDGEADPLGSSGDQGAPAVQHGMNLLVGFVS